MLSSPSELGEVMATSPFYMPVETHQIQRTTSQLPKSSTELDTITKSTNPGTLDSRSSPSFAPKFSTHDRPILGMAAYFLKTLALPIVATAYLAFCYTVHHRVVPVGVDALVIDSPKRLGFVKAGFTSISILIITLGLLPLSSLLQDLKSEEFFRSLSILRSGVPLSTINTISIPSFGTCDSAIAIVHNRCSPYFTAAFFAGFLSIAVSTLAPAALTVDTVLSDGEIVAFAVGAVLPDTVFNTSEPIFPLSSAITDNSEQAASVAWAEISLGVQYSFISQGDLGVGNPPYIIPTPAELPTSASARWLTNVIALQPSCIWSKTDTSQPIMLAGNFSLNSDEFVVSLPEISTRVVMSPEDISLHKAVLYWLDPLENLKNYTTNDPPSDGSTTWLVAQCTSGCNRNQIDYGYVVYNFSGIPTIKLMASDETWELAYLICSPNPTIESCAVRNDGRGGLTRESNKSGTPYRSQENLLLTQTRLLFTYSLTDIPDKSGPSFGIDGLGTKLQIGLVFGADAVTKANISEFNTFTPLHLSNITEGYTHILQSATKVFLSGALGTAYVPGRISYKVVVFSSSLPHIIASTVLFIVLSATIIWAHFRTGKGETFSLFSVAAALDGSSIPGKFSQLRSEQVDLDRPIQTRAQGEDLIAPWGSRIISLDRSQDGSAILHIN